MFLHVLFILSKQPPAEPGYSGYSKDQKRTMESESPVVLSICGDSWYRLRYWVVSWRSIDETRLEMCLSQRSLVRGVPHRRGGTPFGAFQPEIWGISFFVVCSFVSSHSALTISVMSLKMRTSESECEKPSGQTAFHIPSTLSLCVKRATKTQEIIECRNS